MRRWTHMPLSQDRVNKLRDLWFQVSGELVSDQEAWDMATKILCFFDALCSCPKPPVDNSLLTDGSQECDQLGRPIDSS